MTTVVTVSALLGRLQYLFPEANPQSELTAKVENLLSLRAQLKQIIEDADANHNIADEQANSFGREIKKFSYELEDLIESYVLGLTSRRNGFLNRIFKRNSQQKVIEKLQQLQEELSGIIVGVRKPSYTSPQHHALEIVSGGRAGRFARAPLVEAPDEFVKTEDAEKNLESALTGGSWQRRCVSICGMAGIGKTTLARKLFQSPRIQLHFDVRAWVCVSQDYQTRRTLQEILSGISERWVNRRDAMDMSEEDLAERVYKSLKGRRYLIVLDDIWSSEAWFSLRIVFPDDRNGSRILITTRMRELALQVDPDAYTQMMRPLTEDKSWELFRHKAGLDDTELNPEIEDVGREIARRSEGVPLAIVVLASTLQGRPFDEWRRVLEHLGGTSLDQVSDVLDLSYKHLPLRLRPCLLYLGNFPEDSVIEMETVCQLWIAEGLILIEEENGEKMMDVAARYLNELCQRSLVLAEETEVSGHRRFKSFRIHDLIREFLKTKSKDELFDVIDLGDENQTISSAFRRAIYLDKYECTDAHLYENTEYLRSLLFFNSSQSGQGIIRPREIHNLDHYIWLRVLYLYGVDFNKGKLPKGVEKLVYLRYLSFRECYLEELSSSVSNMLYLQTLDLLIRNECEMTIPDVLDNFERLKYLYLPLAYRTPNDEKLHLGRLKELEILNNFDTSLCNSEDLLRLTSLTELAVTTEGDVSEIERILNFVDSNSSRLRYTSLNIRNFDCHSKKRFSVMERVFNSSGLHALGLEGYLGKLPESDKIYTSLRKLVLNGSKLAEDPLELLQELHNLSVLVLEIEAYVGTKMTCNSYSFAGLSYLKLSKLYYLEKWEVEEEAMPKLSTLVIENCKKLQMLPAGLQHISNLQKLEIACMPDEFIGTIQNSDGTEGEGLYKISHLNVKIDGQSLILKNRQQAGQGEDPQSSSIL